MCKLYHIIFWGAYMIHVVLWTIHMSCDRYKHMIYDSSWFEWCTDLMEKDRLPILRELEWHISNKQRLFERGPPLYSLFYHHHATCPIYQTIEINRAKEIGVNIFSSHVYCWLCNWISGPCRVQVLASNCDVIMGYAATMRAPSTAWQS